MDIVKKNMWSIVAGGVALIAIVLSFLPLGGMVGDLNKKLQERKRQYQSIQSLINKPRQVPQVDPDTSEVANLPAFPSRNVIAWGIEITTRVHEQTVELLRTAKEFNDGKLPDGTARHLALSFEATNRTVDPYGFADNYDAWVKPITVKTGTFTPKSGRADLARTGGAAADPAVPAPPPPSSLLPGGKLLLMIKAGVAPTNDEYEWRKEQKREDLAKTATPGRVFGGTAVTATPEERAEADRTTYAALMEVAAAVRRERAMAINTYVPPDGGVAYHPAILAARNANQAPRRPDIWYAQIGLWLQQDLFQAIHDANVAGKTTNVTNSVVKQVLRVLIEDKYVTDRGPVNPMGAGQTGARGPEDPGAAPAGIGGTASPVYAVSPTGRVSNPLYDVFWVTLVVDLDATRLELFLNELTRAKLITVLSMDLVAVDRAAALDAGFDYGLSPVVRAYMKVEVVYFREWMVRSMPKDIMTLLNIQPAAAAPLP